MVAVMIIPSRLQPEVHRWKVETFTGGHGLLCGLSHGQWQAGWWALDDFADRRSKPQDWPLALVFLTDGRGQAPGLRHHSRHGTVITASMWCRLGVGTEFKQTSIMSNTFSIFIATHLEKGSLNLFSNYVLKVEGSLVKKQQSRDMGRGNHETAHLPSIIINIAILHQLSSIHNWQNCQIHWHIYSHGCRESLCLPTPVPGGSWLVDGPVVPR